MIEFQVVGTRGDCGILTSDADVAEHSMQEAVEIGAWLAKQTKPRVTIVIYLPHGGRAFTHISLSALATWVNQAVDVANDG